MVMTNFISPKNNGTGEHKCRVGPPIDIRI